MALIGFLPCAMPPVTAQPQTSNQVRVPENVEQAALAERKVQQFATLSQFEVFHDFQFDDRRQESGISFQHYMVDDIGIRYKPVHYDHGNGVAIADVDGDGKEDIYFLTQLGSNQLWKNLGGGRFRNVTERSGLAMTNRISVAGSFADIDNDGDADLFVSTVRQGNALFRNDGTGRFEDVTVPAGLTYVGHSSAAIFFDYDNDGHLDLFLTNVGIYTTDEVGRGGYYVGYKDAFKGHVIPSRSESSILYRNLGDGGFLDVSEAVLLLDRSWSGDATPVDFNQDGYQDLYVLNMQGDDHYYENIRGKFFVDRTNRLFPLTPTGTMGVKSFDWNNDGLVDLFLTDMHSDMTEKIEPAREKQKARMPEGAVGLERSILGNAFFENTGEAFDEISDKIGAENYWPWGISVDDLNADGWDDVFIAASMNFPFRYGINTVLLNNRGKRFLDSEFILGVEPRRGDLVRPWFELDCSATGSSEFSTAGWEIFANKKGAAEANVAEAPTTHPYCVGRDGKVTILAARGTRSSAILDIDDDGDLDIVTNEFNDVPQVLVSNLATKSRVRYLKVRLVGTTSNRNGLGAKVTVTSGDRFQVKVHDGKSGYLSQSLIPLYFGLAQQDSVDRVDVTWPSGIQQTVWSPNINQTLEILEPKTEPQ